MEISDLLLPYIYLIVVWFANINDLIRGNWFYYSTTQVLFWNLFGILALIYIILHNRKSMKGGKKIEC